MLYQNVCNFCLGYCIHSILSFEVLVTQHCSSHWKQSWSEI